MSEDQPTEGTNPNTRPSPRKSSEEIAEAKRIDKMKTVCASHHVAGTFEQPDQKPEMAIKSQE